MSRTTLLTAAVFLLALALVVALVTRPSTPNLSRAASAVPAAAPVASPDPADSALAKGSTDPVVTGFIDSFRTSSVAACQNSLIATLKNTDQAVADKASTICGCASDRVVGSLTIGEVHASTLSAVNGDAASNPTIQALKTRFSEASKACLADQAR